MHFSSKSKKEAQERTNCWGKSVELCLGASATAGESVNVSTKTCSGQKTSSCQNSKNVQTELNENLEQDITIVSKGSRY